MTASHTAESRSGAQSVERALAVLCSFEHASGDLGISDIAHATGLAVSTAHRLTRALCAAGLLAQDERTDRYQLGPVLVVLGRLAEQRLGLAVVLPDLEQLASDTGESVNLGVLSGSDVLVMVDIPSDKPLRFDQAPGTRVPAHTSAMGKCMLAHSGDINAAVSALPELEKLTPRTITNRRRLRAELETVRERGWALNDEERNPGVRAVAVPVLHGDRAIAAIAVQGPITRLPDSALPTLAERAGQTATKVAPLLTTIH
ncbi:MAG: IclR family transcriptional regulator [Acidimicrobiales bacterium]